jgi:hypothetical protein
MQARGWIDGSTDRQTKQQRKDKHLKDTHACLHLAPTLRTLNETEEKKLNHAHGTVTLSANIWTPCYTI